MALIRAVIAGLLIWAGFAPLELWPAPFIGLLLLFRTLQIDSRLQRLCLSFATGFSFFAPLLHWSGTYVGSLPWLLLALLQASIFALVGALRLTPWSFAAIFTLIELLRMKFPFGGFGWGRVGFTQVEALNHIYPIIGIAGISFLVALISAFISRINLRQSLGITVLLLLPIFNNAITYDSSLKVLAVQGGVDNLGLDFSDRAMSVFNRHVQSTLANRTEIDLVIWPENSVDIDPVKNVTAASAISKLIEEIEAPLLIGAVAQNEAGPENVSILYGVDGIIESKYQKQDLAPFGEYIPLRSIAERIAPEAKRVRDFQPGRSWVFHDIAGHRFASVICFEVLDDDLIRNAGRNSEFLVAQTNNATFGRSPQARQQLQITRARAAELGKDVAVVSTTGFTAKITAAGELESRLEQFTPGALEMSIGTRESNSLASRLSTGFWIAFCGLIALWSRRSVFRR